jgi:hypothetical protein
VERKEARRVKLRLPSGPDVPEWQDLHRLGRGGVPKSTEIEEREIKKDIQSSPILIFPNLRLVGL